MDRIEQMAVHRAFRIIATSSRVPSHRRGEAWDALVSVSKLGSGGEGTEPVMLDLEHRRWPDPERAITEAIAFAKQRIDTNWPELGGDEKSKR